MVTGPTKRRLGDAYGSKPGGPGQGEQAPPSRMGQPNPGSMLPSPMVPDGAGDPMQMMQDPAASLNPMNQQNYLLSLLQRRTLKQPGMV